MRLLIAGAGGHGRVVADLAAAGGSWTQIAFLDDQPDEAKAVGEWIVAGRLSELEALAARFDAFVAAFGDASLRLQTHERAVAAGMATPVLVHPRACVSARAKLEAGTVVVAGAVINVGARLGRCCIVNTGATVDHFCRLEDGVHICPGAHVAGEVTIGARTWFGIGALAKQGIRIGSDVTVGAGAVCLVDVPAGVVVAGVPAKEIRT